MKKIIGAFIAVVLLSAFSISQEKEVKVLKPEISKKYEGDVKKKLAHGLGEAWGEIDHYKGFFKKGFPHGKGVYTWGNGNCYTGDFSKGKMQGQGELRIKRETQADSVMIGYFDADEYIGKYKEPYRAYADQGIRKIEFQKKAASINQVVLMLYVDGKPFRGQINIRDPKNTLRKNISGYPTLTNVNFPLEEVVVSFQSGPFSYSFTFDVFEEGNWVINVSV